MLGVDGGGDAGESGGLSGGSSEVGGSLVGGMEESGGGGGGGTRWPRNETLALLKIRSDMDVTFRDSNLKGPLWDEISRKMAELGFHRSAKKCKEKFENVFKYHKRTKDGRQSKPDAKSYRFFEQLEALENTPTPPPPPLLLPPPTTMASAVPTSTVPSTPSTPTPLRVVTPNNPMSITSFQPALHMAPPPSMNASNPPPVLSNSTSSSTSSDEDIHRRHGKKRKWKDYFQRLLNDVIHKQEDMQRKFLETLEKRERERMTREEAWRVQEMARMNREHELLVQERSVAAAKDAAVIQFLQKVTEQHDLQIPIAKNGNGQHPQVTKQKVQPPAETPQPPPEKPQPPPAPVSTPLPPVQPAPMPQAMTITPTKMVMDATKTTNGGESLTPTSSSRWPKAEIEALIQLRTNLDIKYQENGPKGPLWEEISAGMGRLGYNRNSKRCKEKWENINKYFKKVKESSKKRPEDSKTCPYFHQLDALYKEKAKNEIVVPGFSNQAPIMAQPEQQWPLQVPPQQQPAAAAVVSAQKDSTMHEANRNESDDGDEDDDMEDEEEDEEGRYEIVPNNNNKQPFPGTKMSN